MLLSPWQPPLTHPPLIRLPRRPSPLPARFSEAYGVWVKSTQELTQTLRACTPMPSRPLRDLFAWRRHVRGICAPALLLFQYIPQTVSMSPGEVWSPFPKHAIGRNPCGLFLLTLSPSPLTGHLRRPEARRVPAVGGKNHEPSRFLKLSWPECENSRQATSPNPYLSTFTCTAQSRGAQNSIWVVSSEFGPRYSRQGKSKTDENASSSSTLGDDMSQISAFARLLSGVSLFVL